MDKKKKLKLLLQIITGLFAALTVFALIYIMLYYNVFHKEHTGAMKPPHIVLLVGAVVGLFVSIFILDKIKREKRVVDSRTMEDRLQSLAENHLKERNLTAEKLHLSLFDVVKKNRLIRVRSGFLSYDLLYFIKPGKWFGFTFHEDYRDNFIDIKIGELYHFSDFMPRLIIVGEYAENIKKLNAVGVTNSKIPLTENASKNIKDALEIIENTFESVILNIDIESELAERKRLAPYLIKELSTFKDLKEVDKNAIMEADL
jgi:uncharacterized membrane protein